MINWHHDATIGNRVRFYYFFREGDVVCKWLWWILFLHYVTTFYSTPFFIFKKNFGINVKHRKCITITFNDRIFFFQRYGIISIFWHCFLQCIIYWTIDEDQYCLYKKIPISFYSRWLKYIQQIRTDIIYIMSTEKLLIYEFVCVICEEYVYQFVMRSMFTNQ